MTESFHDDNVFQDQSHASDGLVEVLFNDGDSVILHQAEVRPTSRVIDGSRIHYDQLVSNEGHLLEPYTIFANEDVLRLGNELESTFSIEGRVALQSKRHGFDLGFLAIAATLGDTARLKNDIRHRFYEDANDYPTDLRILIIDEGFDVWVRLEQRRKMKNLPLMTVMAKLAFIKSAGDHVTMVPYIHNYDGSQKVYIPEQLAFGHPWLYVGGEYNDDISQE